MTALLDARNRVIRIQVQKNKAILDRHLAGSELKLAAGGQKI